jgi:hypothetical protein
MPLPRRVRRRRTPKFVFVVTYGRSGSTLMQGLLNTVPGALVRGENNLFVLPLFRSWVALRAYHRKYGRHGARRGVQSAFYGLDEFRPAAYVDSCREAVLPQLYGKVSPRKVRLLGFKEVVWYRVRPRETEQFFDFFDRLFPDARYVLHRRAHENVSKSGFWRKEEPDKVARSLARVEEVQDYLADSRPERTLWTRYEDLTSDDPAVVDRELEALTEFLTGSCDDDLMARMRETLRVGYGPLAFGSRAEGSSQRRARRRAKGRQKGRAEAKQPPADSASK